MTCNNRMKQNTAFEVVGRIHPVSHGILSENHMKGILEIKTAPSLNSASMGISKQWILSNQSATLSSFFFPPVISSSVSWASALY